MPKRAARAGAGILGAGGCERVRATQSQLLPIASRASHVLTESRGLGHDAIEVALEEAVLHDAVLLELALGVRPGDLGCHFARVLQYLAIGCSEEAVQPRLPVLHGHGELAERHVLGNVEVGVHQPRELRELVVGQVVLGHDHVELLDLAMGRVGPRMQAHVLPGGVGAVDDDLGCGPPVDGPVQLVLHGGEEALGGLRRHVVVDRRGVDVGDLLVELALRQPDLADALELLFEVPVAEDGVS